MEPETRTPIMNTTFFLVDKKSFRKFHNWSKVKSAPLVLEKTNQEEVKEKTSYNELDEYQKRRDAERKAELEKARAKLKKNETKSIFIASRKDWSIYGGWVNANLSVNVGKLGSTQGWRIEKPEKEYY